MILDICTSPALYPYYKKENDTVVVVDVFRASATICKMLHNGAESIIPVAGIEEAKQYKSEGFLVGAERNARKCDFADFGNSPSDYTLERVSGKEVVFTTTNGTQAIQAARGCRQLFIGTFSNIDAVLEASLRSAERVVILCAGWENRINIEDMLFGGAFAEKLGEKDELIIGSDSVRIAMELWQQAKDHLLEYVKKSDHYHRLVENGVEADAAYCLQMNTAPVVPYYHKNEKKIRASH
ncbi:2-phosphosulfolactate phosphatase [uncultured Proteiniphilum sp.]|uniref:2-phosphosulfolactate phosphatase n=1 Tax=uncultured Proteiniphilum sp. TaxID=497637 RepID=UPI00262CDC18|nr:2-phosphosulfolactate phosphatase [uncultured Proteiniphilum sp.]